MGEEAIVATRHPPWLAIGVACDPVLELAAWQETVFSAFVRHTSLAFSIQRRLEELYEAETG